MKIRSLRSGLQHRSAAITVLLAVVLAMSTFTFTNLQVTRAQNAGPSTCAQILPEVQKRLTQCSALDRDQVCYGNPAVSATFNDSNTPVGFTKVGDIVDLSALKSLQTTPLDLERKEWGIAALKVQVNNVDGTATGQAATFVLFGDTKLTNATEPSAQAATPAAPPPPCSASTSRLANLRNAPVNGAQSVKVLPVGTPLNVSGRLADGSWLFASSGDQTGWVLAASTKLSCDATTQPVIDPSVPAVMTGLRAFYFTTGVASQASCQDVPQGGFMVKSPTGRHVQFSVEGADITVGSTVEFLKVGGHLEITVLEGQITVTLNGQTVTVKAGQQLNVNVTDGDPPTADGPLPDPIPAQNPASHAVRCAIDPLIAIGCTQFVPTNLGITGNPPPPVQNNDPILRPDGGQGTVIGPFPPLPGQPPIGPTPTCTPCAPCDVSGC